MDVKIIVILVLSIFTVGFYFHRCRKIVETFKSTTDKIRSLKIDLKNLIVKNVGKDTENLYVQSVGLLKEYEVVYCVKKTLKKNKLPLGLFNMDGEKMSDPIIKMYKKDQRVYDVLGNCGFLKLIGRIVSTATWLGTSQEKTKHQFSSFISCLNNINFKDIKVWENMSNPNGEVLKCIKS